LRNRGVVSVVTSCFESDLQETAIKLAEVGVSALDIYCGELPSSDWLMGRLQPDVPGEADWPTLYGDWLLKEIQGAENRARTRLSIVSLTTSFPAISESAQAETREHAISCVFQLLQVAALLHLPCIQIRAGRRIYSSTRPGDRKVPFLFDGEDEALLRVRASLIEVWQRYKGEEKRRGIPAAPAVALEIEPGESFALRGMAQLDHFGSLVKDAVKEGHLPPHWVGLNLDVGHALIFDHGDPVKCKEFLKGSELVLPIYGAHVSDHSLHHAADLPPGFFHTTDCFDDYLRFYLVDVPATLDPEAKKYYSGHVSIELEAVKYLHHVTRAHRVINYRLSEIGQHPRQQNVRAAQACILFADLRHSTATTFEIQGNEGVLSLAQFTDALYRLLVSRVRQIEPRARLDKFIGDAAMIVIEGNPAEVAPAGMKIATAILGGVVAQASQLRKGFGGIGIGIGLGEVAAGFIGPPAFAEETVLGKEVIIAFRLSAAAGPGEILASPSFHEAYRGTVNCNAIPEEYIEGAKSEVRLAGREPVSYWRFQANPLAASASSS